MGGFAVVATLATVLIGFIVLRSPDTHANLWTTLHPGYARTAPIVVGQEAVGDVELALDPGRAIYLSLSAAVSELRAVTTPLDPGRAVYLSAGCATCHGLDARGGPVGPSLANPFPDFPEIVKKMVRDGPGGMPNYSEAHLSDADLEVMAAYLQKLAAPRPNSEEIAAIQNLKWDPTVPQALALQGKAALRRSCAACHTQPTNEEILSAFSTDGQAAGLVAEMVSETNLSLEDARAIAYYMMALLHGADPVKVH
jgi:mono/diheme cytochrome c family protein